MSIAHRLRSIAKDISYPHCLVFNKALFFLMMITGLSFVHFPGHAQVDSLLLVARTPSVSDSIRLKNYLTALQEVAHQNKERALMIGLEADSVATLLENDYWSTRVKENLGWSYLVNEKFHMALKTFEDLAESSLQNEDYILHAKLLTGIASVYNALGYFEESIKLYHTSDSLIQTYATEYKRGQAVVWTNITNAYVNNQEPSRALIYAKKSFDFFTQNPDPYAFYIVLLRLATIHKDLKQPDSSLYYLGILEESVQDKAFDYELDILLLKSQAYYQKNEIDKSLFFLDRLKGFEHEGHSYHEQLYLTYKALGDMEKAIEAQSEYHKRKSASELKREERRREFLGRAEYESKRIELENLATIQQLTLEKERNAKITSLALLILVSIVVCLVYFSYRRALKSKALIEQKSLELESYVEKLRAINGELSQTNHKINDMLQQKSDLLEKYAFHNSHQVRAPLAKIIGLIAFSKESKQMDPAFINMLHEASLELDEMIRRIGKII